MTNSTNSLPQSRTSSTVSPFTNELFALCPIGGKNPYADGWNIPSNAATYSQALAHSGNVGILLHGNLICIDIDSHASEQIATIGDLSKTTTITRDNAIDRIALLYRIDVDSADLSTRKFRRADRTDRSFDIEVLTHAPDGKGKHKLIKGTYKSGRYICDQAHPIRTLSDSEYKNLLLLLTDGMSESGKAKTSTRKAPEKRTATPDGSARDLIDSTPCLDVFTHYGRAAETREERGWIRLSGNGGLLIDESKNSWYCFSDGGHGDSLAAVAYCENGNSDTSSPDTFRDCISKLSAIAGVDAPELNDRSTQRMVENPITGKLVKLDDVLDVMRQMISEHQFHGRNSDYQRQVAVAHVVNFSNAGDVVAHGSVRHLSELAGASTKAVTRANCGKSIHMVETYMEGDEAKTRNVFDRYEGPCLQDWLIQKVKGSVCGAANVWEVHHGVWEIYVAKGNTYNLRVDTKTLNTKYLSYMCFPKRRISEIEKHMGDDAWQRQRVPENLRDPRTTAEHIVRVGNGEKVTTSEYLKSFGAVSLAITSQLSDRPMSVSELSALLGHHRSTISSALKRLVNEPQRAGAQPIVEGARSSEDGRVTLWSLNEEWQSIVDDISPHMYTYGTRQSRKIRHNSERIEFFRKIIPNIQTPVLVETAKKILIDASTRSKELASFPQPQPISTIEPQSAQSLGDNDDDVDHAFVLANMFHNEEPMTAVQHSMLIDFSKRFDLGIAVERTALNEPRPQMLSATPATPTAATPPATHDQLQLMETMP